MILGWIDEAISAGSRFKPDFEIVGLDARTVQRWRSQDAGSDRRTGPRTKPRNALSAKERAKILAAVNSSRFCDKSPKQIVPLLADEGVYIASESTMYQVLKEESLAQPRSTAKPPTNWHRPQAYVATGPNQVWSWDITYLKSPVKGAFFYLYMTLDVWSRKIVAFEVHDHECSLIAAEMTEAACVAEGVEPGSLVIHSDNGGPMDAATMLAKLQALGIATSFSRPSVSKDNPFSESAFRTAKYRPDFPTGPFQSLEAARTWVASFVRWYNQEHRHSSIGFATPCDRHEGHEQSLLENRRRVYSEAKRRRPDRWSGNTRDWTGGAKVTLNPLPVPEVAAAG
jgi:transposase InsO family protein